MLNFWELSYRSRWSLRKLKGVIGSYRSRWSLRKLKGAKCFTPERVLAYHNSPS